MAINVVRYLRQENVRLDSFSVFMRRVPYRIGKASELGLALCPFGLSQDSQHLTFCLEDGIAKKHWPSTAKEMHKQVKSPAT